MLNRESTVPIYIQIQEQLEEMLQAGILKPNDLVPSENEMAEKLKVSRLTVRKSYGEMVKRNLFFTIQGKGTYVKEINSFPLEKAVEPHKSTKVIGVILPEVHGFYGDIFSGIQAKCEETKQSIQLMFNSEIQNEITAIRQMLTSDVDGIIISPSRHSNTVVEHYQKLMSSNIPTVMVGKPPFKISAPCVFCDDVLGVYRAVELLISHENTQIAYVGNSAYEDEASQERYTGYLAAMRDYLPTEEINVLDMHATTFEADVAKAINRDVPVTAFFCYCDMAGVVICEILKKLCKKIPENIEIIGYDNNAEYHAFSADLKITTVDQRRKLLGSEAVALLWKIIHTAETKHTHMEIVVHPQLILKDTTRLDV